MSEKGDNLTFYGNGISVSLDIPINQNYKNLDSSLINCLLKRMLELIFLKTITNYDYIKNLSGYNQFKQKLKNLNKKKK